jgi:hypothetical protein
MGVNYEKPCVLDKPEKPLPCPFCGGPAKVESKWDGVARWRVKCRNRHSKCAVHPKTPYDYASEELAIQAWNGRAN